MTATRGEPDCSRIYFVPTLNLFQSSCPVLMQHSAQLTSEWFPPRHQIQYLTHVFCLLIHPPPGRKLCATCVLLWGKWFGVFYRCRGCFSGWHHMASKMKSGIYDGICIQRNNEQSRPPTQQSRQIQAPALSGWRTFGPFQSFPSPFA